ALIEQALVSHETDRHRGVGPRLEFQQDVDIDWFSSVLAPELPDDVAFAVLVLGGDKRGVDLLAGREVDPLHPLLSDDLPQEILDHAPMREEETVAEIVLAQDFSRRDH